MFDIKIETKNSARLYATESLKAQGKIKISEVYSFDSEGKIASQLTFGEPIKILSWGKDKIKVQSNLDDYCAFINPNAVEILETEALPNYRTLQATVLLTEPNLKAKVINIVPQDSYFVADEILSDYIRCGDFYVDKRHLQKLEFAKLNRDELIAEIVTSAFGQLNRSYIWGGRGLSGLDCSALVQFCYRQIGVQLPRDSDLQRIYLQKHHQQTSQTEMQAGDLIFTPGHVMLAISEQEIIHASGHHLKVVKEKFSEFLNRNPEVQAQFYRYIF